MDDARYKRRSGATHEITGLTASLVGNQKDGALRATSRFVKRGRRVSVVRTAVTGDGDRLLAEVTTSHIPAEPRPS